MSIKKKHNLQIILIFSSLITLFCLRFWLASVNKVINDDEATGLHSAYQMSYLNLLKYGVGGASTSPLFYLIDKFIYDIIGHDLHKNWNLRFITRAVHAFYWAFACSFLFVWCTKRLQQLTNASSFFAIIISAGFSFFLHSNSFMDIYAIETRGYSLWVSLTLIQTLLWLDLIQEPENKKYWIAFAITNFLNCFNSYSALAQMFLNLLFLMINLKIFHEKKSIFDFLKIATFAAIPSVFISFYYYFQSTKMGYPSEYFTLKSYIDSILEIISKTFHHHRSSALIFSFPLLGIIYFYIYKMNRKSIWIPIHCIGSILLTVLFYKASEFRGGIWAPRYVIFLIPSFAIFYFFGLASLSKIISDAISKFTNYKTSPLLLILIWAIIEISLRSSSYIRIAYADLDYAKKHKLYGATNNSECPKDIRAFGDVGSSLEKLNNVCRY
ncbi:MAG: hypothetical protein M9962_05960 [Oligoflexia bacterium]|nr:hypothetical protein [Oligoflexia bacterium]